MEIEAKYTVLDSDIQVALTRLPELAGFMLRDAEVRNILDVYMDTADYQILNAGYACRCRREGDHAILALKGLGSGAGAVHRREELEVEIGKDACQTPDRWPESQVKARIVELSGGQGLKALFHVEQRRLVRYLFSETADPIAELSLDQVEIRNGGGTEQFTELEIELLKAGTESDLDLITHDLASLGGLVVQPASKFERGLALVGRRGRRMGGGESGVLQAGDTMGDAVTKLLRPLFLKMETHEQGTYLGQDPDELHDMRVSTRRMRTVFEIAEPYLDQSIARPIRDGLRKLARVLGAVRDMDVFRTETEKYIAAAPTDQVELARLIEIWNVEYTRRRNEMLSHLRSPQYARCKQAFWTQLQATLPDGDAVTHVREAVQRIVHNRLLTLEEDGAHVGNPKMTLRAYHQLRIDVKHLRYALEFFRDVLNPAADETIEVLKDLQDYFGELHDAAVAADHLRAVIQFGTWELPDQPDSLWRVSPASNRPPPLDGAILAYLRARERDIATLREGAPNIWRHFQRTDVMGLIDDLKHPNTE